MTQEIKARKGAPQKKNIFGNKLHCYFLMILWPYNRIVLQKKCHLHLVAVALMNLKDPSSLIFAPWCLSRSWYQTGLPLGLCVESHECRLKSLQRTPASGTPAAKGKGEGYSIVRVWLMMLFYVQFNCLLAIMLFHMPHPSQRDPWWSISIPRSG